MGLFTLILVKEKGLGFLGNTMDVAKVMLLKNIRKFQIQKRTACIFCFLLLTYKMNFIQPLYSQDKMRKERKC